MKKLVQIVLFAVAAISFAACGGAANNAPAGNSNANSNANTSKPAAAAPTADALFALDKQANDAYLKGDGKFFDGLLSDKFVMNMNGQRLSKAEVVKNIATVKCDAKDGAKL